MEVAWGLGFTVGPILGSALYELGGFGLPLYTVCTCLVLLTVPSVLVFAKEPTVFQQGTVINIPFKKQLSKLNTKQC